MEKDYLISKLKTGRKLAQLDWEEGFALGCVEEDNDVWVWKLNDNFELLRAEDGGNFQVWDATADDFISNKWLVAIDLELEHLEKLGFKYDNILDLYKIGRKYIKIEKFDNYFYIYYTYEGNYNWKEKIKIKFIHEFINYAIKNGLKPKVDIQKECLEEFIK